MPEMAAPSRQSVASSVTQRAGIASTRKRRKQRTAVRARPDEKGPSASETTKGWKHENYGADLVKHLRSVCQYKLLSRPFRDLYARACARVQV